VKFRLPLVLAAFVAQADVRLPNYTHETLPNGIVLDVMPRRDVPLVSIRVLIKGGAESDPNGIAGLASTVGQALRRGTAKRTAEQFSQELDSLGASFRTGVDMQATSVDSEFLAKDFEKGLDLLVEAVTAPTFPEAEITKLLAQSIDSAKAIKDNPSAAASMYFRDFFFSPKHPYGQVTDDLSLSRITRQAIADYHKRQYVGRNMIVIVAGDVQPEKAVASVGKVFGNITAGQAYRWKNAGLPEGTKGRMAIVDKPDATQTEIRIGLPGIERTHPDRVAMWLVNTLFGGRFTSILNDELRVNSGLTYGASSMYERNRLPGRIAINTFTATENTGKTVDMAVSLLKRLTEKGITAEQLASAKAYIKGTYPSEHLETADQLADIIGEIELFSLNRGEVDDLFSRIDAVTLEKANEVARRHYSPSGLVFLLLGNAAKFTDSVKKYDPDPVIVPIGRPGLRVVQ
jgi:predicted Zn-dependent peptidase